MWSSPDGYGSISRTDVERSSASPGSGFGTCQARSAAQTACHFSSIRAGSYRSITLSLRKSLSCERPWRVRQTAQRRSLAPLVPGKETRHSGPIVHSPAVVFGLPLPRIWAENLERRWLWERHPVALATMWLAPSYGYGLDRVPSSGGAVLAANHLSAIDPPLIGVMSPRAIRYMAKAELMRIPVVGQILASTGAFPVRRGEADRNALRLARELVRSGDIVGIFMEGTRQKFGFPGEVQAGATMIALQEEVPIIPYGVYSFGWSRNNRAECAVVWGEPVRVDD